MDTSFEYRSFVISHDGCSYSAQSNDGEPFQIRSREISRLTRAIDALWSALEEGIPAPAWVYADLVDIDAASGAMLVVDRPGFPTFPLEPVGEPVLATA